MSRMRIAIELLAHPATGGVVLLLAAVLALVLANSPLYGAYEALLATPVTAGVGALVIDKPLLLWVNDGLMAVFFFQVGLEIKREVLEGHLAEREQILLPGAAALGGMIVPALIYAAVNFGEPGTLKGWAIPAATDIAFALGILALLGQRVPTALKVFLLALAIIDDLGAIVIIALFYTAHLSLAALGLALLALLVLFAMNRMGVGRTAPYVLVGVVLWVCVLKSGVHATLAGVAVALLIPLRDQDGLPLVERIEHDLAPYVSFFIMPFFAFANAGVPLIGIGPGAFLAPLPLGILLGLVVGKQVGVMGGVLIARRAFKVALPENVTWPRLYGVACLAGIGFTMSLFIGTLSFESLEHEVGVRLGVLGGSLISAVIGFLVLLVALPKHGDPIDA
ncbi:MAG: Na+/H+ antiporter NhaA [Geminicoccaceae bacterium]|nr:Na+/H+ antiporter NhaA [Geminicoccaceae bacterium]